MPVDFVRSALFGEVALLVTGTSDNFRAATVRAQSLAPCKNKEAAPLLHLAKPFLYIVLASLRHTVVIFSAENVCKFTAQAPRNKNNPKSI